MSSCQMPNRWQKLPTTEGDDVKPKSPGAIRGFFVFAGGRSNALGRLSRALMARQVAL